MDWYIGLPVWLKYGVAVLLLGISTAMYFGGWFWPWGWGVGGVMLIFAGIGND